MKIAVTFYRNKKDEKKDYTVYTAIKTGKSFVYRLGEKQPEPFWYMMKCINNGYKIIKSDVITDTDVIISTAIYETY